MNTINLQSGDYAAAYQALKKHEKYKRAKADAERGKDLAGFVGRYINIDDPKHRQAIYPLIIQAQNICLLWPADTKQTRSDIYSSEKAKNTGIEKLQELDKNPEYKQELQNHIDQNAKISVLQIVYSRDPDKFESVFTNKTLKERFNRTGRFSALMKCTAHHGLPQSTENLPYLTATVKLQKKIEKVSLWECIRTFSFRKTVYLRKLRKQFDQDPSSISRHELEVIAANKDYCKRFCDKTLTETNLQNHIKTLKQAKLEPIEPVEQPQTITPEPALPETKVDEQQLAAESDIPVDQPEATATSNTCTDIITYNKTPQEYHLVNSSVLSDVLDDTKQRLMSFSSILKTLTTKEHKDRAQKQIENEAKLAVVRANSADRSETSKQHYSRPFALSIADRSADPIKVIQHRYTFFKDVVNEGIRDEEIREPVLALARIFKTITISCISAAMDKEAYAKIKKNFDFLLTKLKFKYEDLTLQNINNLDPYQALLTCHRSVQQIARLAVAAGPLYLPNCREELSNIFTFIVLATQELKIDDPNIQSIIKRQVPSTPIKGTEIPLNMQPGIVKGTEIPLNMQPGIVKGTEIPLNMQPGIVKGTEIPLNRQPGIVKGTEIPLTARTMLAA